MATYYVATTGVNDPARGSEALPWKTVDYGVKRLKSGDTLYVRGGTYYETVDVNVSNVDIMAYPGEKPVIDGRAGVGGVNNGLPEGNAHLTNPDDGAYMIYSGLVDITGSDVLWDGIDVMRSRGQAIRVFPANGARADLANVFIQNCTLHYTYAQVLLIAWNDGYRATHVTVTNVEMYDGGMFMQRQRSASEVNWPGGIGVVGSHHISFDNITLHDIWGEGIIVDTNDKGSNNINIIDSTFYDTFRNTIAFHAAQDVVMNRCVGFMSAAGTAKYGATMICQVHSVENSKMAPTQGKNVVIKNCLFQSRDSYALGFTGAATAWNPPVLENVQVINCTLIAATTGSTGFFSNVRLKKDIVIKNCLVTGPGKMVSNNNKSIDNNFTYSNNAWRVQPEALYNAATDVIGGLDLYNANYQMVPTGVRVDYYKIKNTSDAIDAGIVVAGVLTDFYQTSRGSVGSSCDCGFHEESADEDPDIPDPPSLTAGFTVDVSVGPAPLTVNFTDTSVAANGATIDERIMFFGDGEGQTAGTSWQETYTTPGKYIAKLQIRDYELLIYSTYQMEITVQQPASGGTSDILTSTFEQAVSSSSSSTVIAHGLGDTPSAVMLRFAKATADATPVSEIYESVGFSDGTNDVCVHALVETGVIDGDRQLYDDCAVVIAEVEGGTYSKGSVTLDATNITITWDNPTPTAGTIQGSAFGGDEASAAAGIGTLGTTGLQAKETTGFEPSVIFFLSVNQEVGTAKGWGAIDFGAATPVNQAVVDFGISGTTEVVHRSEIREGKVMKYCMFNNYLVAVNSFESDGFILNITGTDANEEYAYLALNLGSIRVDVSVVETGTDATVVSYPLGFEPQWAMHVLTPLNAKNTYNPVVDTAGFGISDSDSAVSRSMWGYDTPGASVSDANTIKNSDSLLMTDYNGDPLLEATHAFDENGVLLDITTAPAESLFLLQIAIEAGVASDVPTVNFTVDKRLGGINDTFYFTDLSSDNVTQWEWRFSNEGFLRYSEEQNPEIIFGEQGVFDVRLLVTAPGGSRSMEWLGYITVIGEETIVDFTATPQSGPYPLTTILQDNSDVGEGNIPEFYSWELCKQEDYYGPENDVGVQGIDINADSYLNYLGKKVTVTLPGSGAWVVQLTIHMTNGQEYFALKENFIHVEINEPTASFYFHADLDTSAPVGITFYDSSDLKGEEIISREWTIDGDIYTGVTEVKHYFETPGTKNASLYVETAHGSDTYAVEIAIDDRVSAIIGYSDPDTITPTSKNVKSRKGHTHKIPSSATGGPNVFIYTDENSGTRINSLGINTAHRDAIEDFLDRDWTAPLSVKGFINVDHHGGGIINDAGRIILAGQWEIKLHSQFGQIVPKDDRYNSLGTKAWRWFTASLAKLVTNMLVPQNMVSGIGGIVISAPSACLVQDMSETERVSGIVVDRINYMSNEDVLLVTNGEDFEFMRCKFPVKEEEEYPPPGYTETAPEDSEDRNPFIEELVNGSVYGVDRDITDRGRIAWKKGDIVYNIGQSGDGFFEWYSSHSLANRLSGEDAGKNVWPVFRHNVRTNDNTSYEPDFWVGDLNGHYRITGKRQGAAIGRESGTYMKVHDGELYFFGLPTSDPHVLGQAYLSGNQLMVSGG